ncbi:MAG: hypothetical protein ACPGLY_27435 [Rubripirellula sp.]
MAIQSGIRAGEAFLKFGFDTNEVFAQLRRFERRVRSVGNNLRNLGSRLSLGGTAGTGFFGLTLREAARFEQIGGRFDSVLGGLADRGRRFSDALAGSINQSTIELQDQLATFQAVLRGSGFSDVQAIPIAEELVRATQDLIAFDDNIRSSDEAVRRLLSGLAGEIEAVRRFGADVRVSAVDQELLAQGINKTSKEASQAERVVARFAIIQRALTRAGITGQAVREVNTLSSLFRGMSAQVRLASGTLGEALAPSMTSVLQATIAATRGFREFAKANPELTQGIAITTVSLTALGVAMTGVGLTFTGVASLASTVAGAISLIGAPAVAAVAAIGLLTASSIDFREALQDLGGFVQTTLNPILSGIVDAVSRNDFKAAGQILSAGLKLMIADAQREVIDFIRNSDAFFSVGLHVAETFQKGFREFGDFFNLVEARVKDLVALQPNGGPNVSRAIEEAAQANEVVTISDQAVENARKARLELFGLLNGLEEQKEATKEVKEETDKATESSRQFFEGIEKTAVAAVKPMQEMRQQVAEAERLFESTRTPAEQLTITLDRLGQLLQKNAIDWEVYGRAVEQAQEKFERDDPALKRQREQAEGFNEIFKQFDEDRENDVAQRMQEVEGLIRRSRSPQEDLAEEIRRIGELQPNFNPPDFRQVVAGFGRELEGNIRQLRSRLTLDTPGGTAEVGEQQVFNSQLKVSEQQLAQLRFTVTELKKANQNLQRLDALRAQ